jgi:hypothetical protein
MNIAKKDEKIEIKAGNLVKYVCENKRAQAYRGRYTGDLDDLILKDFYVVTKVKVYDWYTAIRLNHVNGTFNDCLFKVIK